MSELKKFIVDLKSFLNEYQTKEPQVQQNKELKNEPNIFELNLISSKEHNALKEKFNNLQQKYDLLHEKYIQLEVAIERGCNSNTRDTKNFGRLFDKTSPYYSNALQYIYDTVDREIEYRDKVKDLIHENKELKNTNRDLLSALQTIQKSLKSITQKTKI